MPASPWKNSTTTMATNPTVPYLHVYTQHRVRMRNTRRACRMCCYRVSTHRRAMSFRAWTTLSSANIIWRTVRSRNRRRIRNPNRSHNSKSSNTNAYKTFQPKSTQNLKTISKILLRLSAFERLLGIICAEK